MKADATKPVAPCAPPPPPQKPATNHVDLYLDALAAVDRFADDETIARGQRKASLEELAKEIKAKAEKLNSKDEG